MGTSTRFVTPAIAALALIGAGLGTGPASAEAGNGALVPLTANYRACDFDKVLHVGTDATGSGTAVIGTHGTNTVTADVFLMIGRPNTAYQVRLIQGPRTAMQRCNAGDPGVASAMLNVDGNGVGSVTLRDARRAGATIAWVFIEGPPDPGQIRGEYYTSDLPTSLK
ncbi:hypothetical protein A5662_04655 [Mycobacteriaceae bacterium 1482268.1]|nr:hypothetical protein A5662_04655 [Mycobacteriaceae bacterium 1482268.1]